MADKLESNLRYIKAKANGRENLNSSKELQEDYTTTVANEFDDNRNDDNDAQRTSVRDDQKESSFSALETIPPCLPLIDTRYSLENDMIFGWKPKYTAVAPIPLKFFNNWLDDLVWYVHNHHVSSKKHDRHNISEYHFPEVVYQGFRPNNSLLIHILLSSEDSYVQKLNPKLMLNGPVLDKYIKGEDGDKGNTRRPFQRMKNHVQDDCLIFDSHFESGNLDTVIRTGVNEYDIFMRVDSNTRGHTSWFYFTVQNMKKDQKVRFNLINFSKNESLFERGMKPFVYSEVNAIEKKTSWVQEGDEVTFARAKVRYYSRNFDEET